ncbi:centromere protein S [Dorcoceras hygrometricum]|uniref:Centromere protein S n=1 Tax=Dorcoceras hygrometricum TaxID=472368 RepID=A0A2Z7ARE3_9LAMI|nr:centromere protein S [Dorcoceras hygrometricum]
MATDVEREGEEDESGNQLLRDRFRLCTISIAEAEAKKNGMEVSQPIMACISDLAFKYAQQLAKDLELFARHGTRKSVSTKDVILSAHRNDHLATSLRSFCYELKQKVPQSEKRRKIPKKEYRSAAEVLHIADS